MATIRANGPIKVLPEKTRIAFQVRMSFAVAIPRHLHAFRLVSPDQIDAEFREWLAEAYAVGAQRHLD